MTKEKKATKGAPPHLARALISEAKLLFFTSAIIGYLQSLKRGSKKAYGLPFCEGGIVPKTYAACDQQIEKLDEDDPFSEHAAHMEEHLRDTGYYRAYEREQAHPSQSLRRQAPSGCLLLRLVALYESDSSLRKVLAHKLTYVERKTKNAVLYSYCGKQKNAKHC